MNNRKHVVIIGGGITGLAAAFYLKKVIHEKNLPINFTLIEASHKLGGKIETVYRDGFVIETGPDSFLARKKSAAQFADDVGLADDVIANETGQAYVLHDDKLHPIPKDAVMGIPTTLSSFLSSRLLSPIGKLRAVVDLVIPSSTGTEDRSLGNFFRRRFGNETVDRLIEPLLSGIYAGNLDRLSTKATFPQFLKVEQDARSLILGLKKMRPTSASGKKKPLFLTLKHGLQSLVEKIEQQFTEKEVVKRNRVKKIDKDSNGYTVNLADGKTIEADAVISTAPHNISQSILPHYSFLQPLSEVTATSVATVVLAFPASHVKLDEEGTGFVVSRQADYTITACTWTHKKWPHTTPKGKVLLRCYVGKAGDEAIVEKSDDEIVTTVLKDLRRFTVIDGEPDFSLVTRWKEAMPQYVVGHQTWVNHLQAQMNEKLPGVFLAGASYQGVGIPDCIDQGKQAVDEVQKFLKRN